VDCWRQDRSKFLICGAALTVVLLAGKLCPSKAKPARKSVVVAKKLQHQKSGVRRKLTGEKARPKNAAGCEEICRA